MNTPNNDGYNTMKNNNQYPTELSLELKNQLSQVNELNEKLKKLRQKLPKEANEWNVILEKLRSSWTYHSNAIEGSTLSLGDTIFFLQEGLTVQGKPLKDYLDAHNHAEAIDYLFDVIANKRTISTGLIKEINALLLQGVKSTPAVTTTGQKVQKKLNAGEYKKQPNHVLTRSGEIHKYVEPEQVASEMDYLIEYINSSHIHPIALSAIAHYNMVRIHPFDDGNGRGARILMNLILMRYGFYPAVIRREDKPAYLDALVKADNGDLTDFIKFISKQLETTLIETIDDLNNII